MLSITTVHWSCRYRIAVRLLDMIPRENHKEAKIFSVGMASGTCLAYTKWSSLPIAFPTILLVPNYSHPNLKIVRFDIY